MEKATLNTTGSFGIDCADLRVRWSVITEVPTIIFIILQFFHVMINRLSGLDIDRVCR